MRRVVNVRVSTDAHTSTNTRTAILNRDFSRALDVMGHGLSFGPAHSRFLDRAFRLRVTSERGRAICLRYVWCRAKTQTPATHRLRLLRYVPSLRRTVPADWPSCVRVYRGAWCHTSWADPPQRARRCVRRGISWTRERVVARRFANQIGGVGCVGTASVKRRDVLAYFIDPKIVHHGDTEYAVEGYHQHECIIDPTSIQEIQYKIIETPPMAVPLIISRGQ